MPDTPIFVVGAMRSGTTLLRLVLDSHDRIAIGPESGFMRAAAAVKTVPSWDYGAGWYTRFGWSDEEIDRRLGSFFGEIFQRYAAQQGKARWGEKTPFHVWHLELMARMFPDALFLAIVRHPGAVVGSMVGRWQYDVETAARYWVRANTEIARVGADLGDRVALCRYEDVVLAPETTLREVTDFLGEEWSESLLAHHEIQRSRGAPRVVDGGTRSRQPIDDAPIRRWVDQMAAADLGTVAATVGPLAAFFGYEPRDPLPARPLVTAMSPGSGGTALARGDDLRRMQDAAPAIGFEPQHELELAEGSVQDLAERLARAEGALARMRGRRSVRIADAVTRVKRARHLDDVRAAVRHAVSR